LQDGRQLEGELLQSMSGRYEIGGTTFDEIEELDNVT
jgi:hypothetical protein